MYNWLSYGVVGNSVCRLWESCTLAFPCSVNKDLQAIGAFLQDKIGAASHDDAGLFFRKLPDDPVLQLPEQILVGGAEAAVGEGRGEEAAGLSLIHI